METAASPANHAVATLRAHGIDSGAVNAGGDLLAFGRREDGSPRVIGVADPRQPDRVFAQLRLTDLENETHVRVPHSDEMWVFPILRFHRQSGSRYFGLPGTQPIETEFFTADRDLSGFDSWRYGAGWKWVGTGGGTLGWLPFRSIEARVTVYERSDGFRAVRSRSSGPRRNRADASRLPAVPGLVPRHARDAPGPSRGGATWCFTPDSSTGYHHRGTETFDDDDHP